MEKFDFPHSLKNIPVPSNKLHTKFLISQSEKFFRRVRWASDVHLFPEKYQNPKVSFGFKSPYAPPASPHLTAFESTIQGIMANLSYTDFRTPFQRELAQYAAKVNNSDKIFLMADKTTNIYQVSVDFYKKLLHDNITKDYKIAEHHVEKLINEEAKGIAKDLELEDRIEQFSDQDAFCTIKDHKDNFENNPKCRLINPAKSQIGKISRQILQNMNSEIRNNLQLNQWQSTKEVLGWFDRIGNKSRKSFLQLDIVEFYPSITPQLLDKALHFAETTGGVTLTPQQKKIILHSRKSLLFSSDGIGKKVWQKKNSHPQEEDEV